MTRRVRSPILIALALSLLASGRVAAADREHQQNVADIRMLQEQTQQIALAVASLTDALKAATAQLEKRLDQQTDIARKTAADQKVLLDNMAPAMMREAVALCRGRASTEASGGITLATVRAAAETGVDFISIGALTHSVRSLDVSLEVVL